MTRSYLGCLQCNLVQPWAVKCSRCDSTDLVPVHKFWKHPRRDVTAKPRQARPSGQPGKHERKRQRLRILKLHHGQCDWCPQNRGTIYVRRLDGLPKTGSEPDEELTTMCSGCNAIFVNSNFNLEMLKNRVDLCAG